jgi:hypothetical protein
MSSSILAELDLSYQADGTGAVARPLAAKIGETISVDDFGAVGDGSVDDLPAIVAAQDALVALGGGELLFTRGKTYRIDDPIPMKSGLTYKGSGSSGIDQVSTTPGAKIIPVGTSAFTNDSGLALQAIKFENLFIHSEASTGEHIFDWSLAGAVAKIEVDGCTFIQDNADKYIINGTASGGVFSIWMHDCDYRYQTANSVSPLYFRSSTVNSIVIERFWSTCATGATSGVPSIHLESTNSAGPVINCVVRDGVFELPGGGAVKMLSCSNSGIENCTVYDLTAAPNNPQFEINDGAGPPSTNCWLRGVRSTVGTTSQPDCKLDTSVSGQGNFAVIECNFSYLDGGSAAGGPGVTIRGSTITHLQNIAYVRYGGGPQNDIVFGSTDSSSKSWAIWNGFSGTAQGYLNIDLNGSWAGGMHPAGLFMWGGTRLSPGWYVTGAGLSYALGGHLITGATGQLGFAAGAGGQVTQSTSKSTGVTLNKPSGAITMNNASLAAGTAVGFTLTNSQIAATDVVLISIRSGATADSYDVTVDAVTAGSCRISLRNVSGGSLGDAVVMNFVVLRGTDS